MWNIIDEYWDAGLMMSLLVVHFLAIFSAA